MSVSQSTPVDTERKSPDTIPAELRALPQWVTWRLLPPKEPGAKPRKPPTIAGTRREASSTDPATWRPFAEARTAVETGRADGIGFVLTEDDPYVGIDLDDCRNPGTGEIAPWALAIVARLGTYTEVSPSGTGLHLIGRGVKPGTACRAGTQIECYDAARYLTVTGEVLAGYDRIRSCQRELTAWYRETWPEPARPATPAPVPAITRDDAEVIATLRRIAGETFARLYNDGDTSGHGGDASRADLALMNHLAWASGGDAAQMERLFGTSALGQREKWVTRADYRARTIARAIDGRTDYYTPPAPAAPTPDREPDPEPAPEACDELRAELERERARRRAAEADRSALIALVLNPHVKESEKRGTVAALDAALRGRPDPEGYVLVRPGTIANDWRPAAKTGRNQQPLNGDGSKPRMSRESVRGTMRTLTERGLIDAEPQAHEVRPREREPYAETAWRVKRPASLAAALAPLATYIPEQPAARKPRTLTCPECGEAHPMRVQTIRRTTCTGCGAVHDETTAERVVQPIVQIGPAGDDRSEIFSDVPAATTISNHRCEGTRSENLSHVSTCGSPTSDRFSDLLPDPAPAVMPMPPTRSGPAGIHARLAANGWE